MMLTTFLLYDVMRERWHWPRRAALPLVGLFLVVDVTFFCANLLKILDGGFVPLLLGAALFTIMITWHRGVGLIRAGLPREAHPEAELLSLLQRGLLPRTDGSAVFLSRRAARLPPLVSRYLTLYGALPRQIATLYIEFLPVARVAAERRLQIEAVADGVWYIKVCFGFFEVPNLVEALREAGQQGCAIDLDRVLFLAANDDVTASLTAPKLAPWRRMLFGFLYRNAVRAPDRFALPRDRFIEIGRQVEL